ncbi:BREX-2 system ATPase PglY [Streptomyces lichenis]|uniref:Phage resistance protein n=1 Tax=Streptomyces lichenis TaxID=2306967 RepID=A0ABT0I3W9_9ACTN|nr:phage resistance protein [Streptomyces lichenis]MCK8676028.1 phage resistance protein [Streptomyces lichenis]
MAQQPPLLRDVIDIKESISTSDFVLRLSEATTPEGAEAALRDYVVTERLLENFDEALGLIKAALDGGTSKAAYLHGSFGSGKSHFMAVLHALLSGSPAARGRADLDPVLTKHEWLGADGKRFLLVPYHMLGAKALEQRVLGGYVSHVKRLHPEAPTPQVYRTDALFGDIRAMRARMSDTAVIAGLASADGVGEEDEWGESFAWTPELLDTALDAEEVHEDVPLNLVSPSTPAELRARLVEDAVTSLLPNYTRNAAEDEHGFVSLDAGLSVIAAHAKSLGYDGLILFLDELILWLATLIHNQKFVAREAAKITNFVEGGDARRAIPVVSFIARQRDLRELVGEEVSGAAEASIQDTLNLASGRFDKITLEDRNLPQVAHARLLKPRDEAAATQIAAEFDKTRKLRQEVWDTLLGSDRGADGIGADEASFRLTYPFSPAFMDTLVHVSSALQRNRTGMKLMGQLLADHRHELRLGDLIPVGDLYPLITAGGDKPFTDSLKVIFEAADKLYRTKLRPYLLLTHGVTEQEIEQYTHRPDSIEDESVRSRVQQFTGDNRIVGTLLLSALAPSVPALSDLTIRRLSALNYGSVTAPIPGREYGILKNKVAEWAGRFPEIKETGTDANPGVRLELSGVDVDSVVANANVNDNANNREELARRLLIEELGIEQGQLWYELPFVWRGTERSAEVVFGDVAAEEDLPDHLLSPAQEGRWRIVIDLPFNEGEYRPMDDLQRMRRLRERQGEPSRTVAWLPTHLSGQRYADFRRLVTLDKALADPERFDGQYAKHLTPDNRSRAKGLLETQRDTLLKNVKAAFKQAYGLADKKSTDVELGFTEHLESLREVEGLTLSFGHSLHDGIRHVAGKLLADQYPDHPELDPDRTGTVVKTGDARKVFTHVRAAAEARDGRAEVPAADRALMRRIAGPLRLGEQKEAYFEVSRYWPDHFGRLAREKGVTGDLSLITLTDWTDLPTPRGLPGHLSRLVVAAYAEMDDRVWVRAGVPLDPAPALQEIKDHDALRSQPLPSEEAWEAARSHFTSVFGVSAPTLRRGRIVNQFARQIHEQAGEYREKARGLLAQLEAHSVFLQLDETDESGRLALARRSVELIETLDRTAGQGAAAARKAVEALASFDFGAAGADRLGTSIKQAKTVTEALNGTSWKSTLELASAAGPEGAALLESLRNAARSDQRTHDLAKALQRAQREVLALIKRNQASNAVQPGPAPAPAPGPADVPLDTPSSHPAVPQGSETTPAPSSSSSGGASGGGSVRQSGGGRTKASRAVAELQAELASLVARHPDATIEISWRVVES